MSTFSDQHFPAWKVKRVWRKDDFLLTGRYEKGAAPTALFENFYAVKSKATFFYSVAFNGEQIKKGRFRVIVRYTKGIKSKPTPRIYQDTDFDRFVNYCINGGKRIWSHNKRLFCYETGTGRLGRPAYSYTVITGLH